MDPYNGTFSGQEIDAAITVVREKEAVWDELANTASAAKTAASAALKALPTKQGTLAGQPGQVVGFGTDGEAVAVQGWSNPNILINADFRKPVNRNGKTEYISSGFTVDRWYKSTGSSAAVIVTEEGLGVSKGNPYIRQFIDRKGQLAGKTITCSALFKNLGLLTITVENFDAGKKIDMSSVGSSAPSYIAINSNYPNEVVGLGLSFSEDPSECIKAVKVELGSQQTLAHQDADGSWMLNDPVDYEAEYAKCAQYDPDTGEWTGYNTGGAPSDGIPSGCILIWSGSASNIPAGWALCDGANGTPDLRGRFVLGESENHEMGSTGGSEEVTLTTAQMPSHAHSVIVQGRNNSGIGSDDYYVKSNGNGNLIGLSVSCGKAGSSEPHLNMPPYYTLCYIMKL